MTCKVIKIEGNSENTFVDGGKNFFIDFQRANIAIPRKYSVNVFNKKTNNIKILLKIKALELSDKQSIEQQKYNDIYSESSNLNINPFNDKNASFVHNKKNTTIYKRKVGHYNDTISHLENDALPFVDKEKFSTKDFVSLTSTDSDRFDYPIQFNNHDFYRKNARIDIFDSVNRIKINSLGVDLIKGVKGFSLNSGVNALKENNIIKSYTTKKDNNNIIFEDAILTNIVYNYFDKHVITQDNNGNIIKTKVNKISNEPRFVKFESNKISPYYDIRFKKEIVKNDEVFYYNALKDIEMEEILRNNRHNNFNFEEQKLFSPAGRSVDYSKNFGIESISYYESLD